jgi:hypothetical protein
MSQGRKARADAAAIAILRKVSAETTHAARLRALQEGIASLPEDLRDLVELMVTISLDNAASVVDNNERQAARRDRIGCGVAGGFSIAALVVIALKVPNPTAFQERTFTLALALAAAFCGALLPGALAVEGHRPSVRVRATGATALAVFVILVYKYIL